MASAGGTHSGFFYGTLMAPAVLSRVCFGPDLPDSTTTRLATLSFTPAILPGYRRHRVKSADYPGIVENAGAEVRGTYVTGLTDGDLWRLDTFEGDEYVRRQVRVRTLGQALSGDAAREAALLPPLSSAAGQTGAGQEVEASTYVWIAGADALEEEEWDFAEFVREKMWRWVGKGAEQQVEYQDVDRAVAAAEEQSSGASAVEDPTRGRGMDGSITRALEQGIS